MKVMKVILSRHGLTILFTTFTVLAILAIRVVPDYVADTRNIGADEPISHHEDDFVEDPPSSYPKVAQFYPSLLPTFTKTPSLFPAVKPSMIVTKESPTAAPISANTQSTTSPTTSKTAGLQRTPDETSELITTGSPNMTPSPNTSCNVVISMTCFVEDAQGTKTNCKDMIPKPDDECVKEVKYTYIVTSNGDRIENITSLDRTRDGDVTDLSDFLIVHDTSLGHFGIASETDTLDFCMPRIVTTSKSSSSWTTPCCFNRVDLQASYNFISPVNLPLQLLAFILKPLELEILHALIRRIVPIHFQSISCATSMLKLTASLTTTVTFKFHVTSSSQTLVVAFASQVASML